MVEEGEGWVNPEDLKLTIAVAVAAEEWRKQNPDQSPPLDIGNYELQEVLEILADITWRALGAGDVVDQAPGHVRLTHDGAAVFIPYNLGVFFPTGPALEELIQLADRVRISEEGIVCISGSATLMGEPLEVSDLDFCEYLDHACPSIFDRATRIFSEPAENPYCAYVRWGGIETQPPWQKQAELLDSARAAFSPDGFKIGQTWKLEYVSATPILKVLQTSNLGIPVRGDEIETWADGKSWTAQEAPITRGGLPPRFLSAEHRVAQYGVWLRGEIDKLRPADPMKAAKRALSLSNLLLLRDQSTALMTLLKDREIGRITRRKALKTMTDLLAPIAHGRGRELHEEASAELAALGGAPGEKDKIFVQTRCGIVVDEAMKAADELLGDARKILARN